MREGVGRGEELVLATCGVVDIAGGLILAEPFFVFLKGELVSLSAWLSVEVKTVTELVLPSWFKIIRKISWIQELCRDL